jgi:photosystem II oxygen-evolving enhancer protein 1
MKFFTFLSMTFLGAALAFQQPMTMKSDGSLVQGLKQAAAGALLGGALFFGSPAPNAEAITRQDLDSLSYLQVKGTGLANRCPEVVGEGKINIQGNNVKLVDLCIEPKTWQVEEEKTTRRGDTSKEFVNTKLMSRQTYTLDGISGDLKVNNGKIEFKEKDGIDYAATTVQLPGGERVPFLFSVKELVATGAQSGSELKPGFQMGGGFKVPSYRTGLFLDPKGRGAVTGYDQAVALPALQADGGEGQDELFKESNKTFDVFAGNIEFEVNKVNVEEGEIGGVFVSQQPGDTDMGSKVPKQILLKGIFYGRIATD